MGHVARGVGNIDVSGVMKQKVVKISSVFVRWCHVFDFTVVYNGSKLRTGGEVWCLDCLVSP